MSALIKKYNSDNAVIELVTKRQVGATKFRVVDRPRNAGSRIDLIVIKEGVASENTEIHAIEHTQDLDDLIAALMALRETYR